MIALVVLVVFGLLGVIWVRVQSLSLQSSALQVLNERALLAAESGVQLGLYRLFRRGESCAALDGVALDIQGEPSLAQCQITLSCTQLYAIPTGGAYVRLTGDAHCGVTTKVYRQLEVELKTP